MNKLPEGWTDDMTIAMPTGRSLDDVTNAQSRLDAQNMERALTAEEKEW